MSQDNRQLLEDEVIGKIIWRIIPIPLVSYILIQFAFINVSLSSKEIYPLRFFSEETYSHGKNLFWIAFILFSLPSLLLLKKIGIKKWGFALLFCWGILSIALAFVVNESVFYWILFGLGVISAGFFPGVLVDMNRWLPLYRYGKVMTLFILAIPLAHILGEPVAISIVRGVQVNTTLFDGQWIFLVEGLMALIVSGVLLLYQPEKNATIDWLTEDEKIYLIELNRYNKKQAAFSWATLLKNKSIWQLIGVYTAILLALENIIFWMPVFFAESGIGGAVPLPVVVTITWGVTAIFIIVMGFSATRHNECRGHFVVSMVLLVVGFVGAGLFPNNAVIMFVALTLSAMGCLSAFTLFWQLPFPFLSSNMTPVGIAIIYSMGSISGFAAPYLMKAMREEVNNPSLGFYIIAAIIALNALTVFKNQFIGGGDELPTTDN